MLWIHGIVHYDSDSIKQDFLQCLSLVLLVWLHNDGTIFSTISNYFLFSKSYAFSENNVKWQMFDSSLFVISERIQNGFIDTATLYPTDEGYLSHYTMSLLGKYFYHSKST